MTALPSSTNTKRAKARAGSEATVTDDDDTQGSLRILTSSVYDPALEGEEREHTRLEVLLGHVPEEPTRVDIDRGPFTVTWRHWLLSIFTDSPEFDTEQPETFAAQFNSHWSTFGIFDPVMPVTVAAVGTGGQPDTWQVFYVRVKRVNRILRHIARNGGPRYEAMPHPVRLMRKEIAYYIGDPTRTCVRCVREAVSGDWNATPQPGAAVMCLGTDLRPIHLCERHQAARNYWHASQRALERD